jgi:hypothetical protein
MPRPSNELDEQDLALIAQIRASAPHDSEPDWDALQVAIRKAVSTEPVSPWWRRWQLLFPIGGLAVTAACLLVLMHSPRETASTVPPPMKTAQVAAPGAIVPATVAPSAAAPAAVWLDGEPVELDNVDDTMFDDLDRDLQKTLGDDAGTVTGGILSTRDLRWIEDLDEASIERVEHWLDRKKT